MQAKKLLVNVKKLNFSITGSLQCMECFEGKYSNGNGTICTPCPLGKYSNKYGSSECDSCPPGIYSNVGEIQCKMCSTWKYVNKKYNATYYFMIVHT